MAAALGQGEPDDQRQDQAAQLGLDPETARAWIASQQTEEEAQADPDDFWAGPGEPFPVWPENWPAMQVWMTLQGSWHRTWRGRLLGLRWGEVEAVIRLGRMRRPRRLLQHLREMQAAAVAASNAE